MVESLMRYSLYLKKLGCGILDVIFPVHCAVCGVRLDSFHESGLCKRCVCSLKPYSGSYCHRCGSALQSSGATRNGCRFCSSHEYAFDHMLSIFEYADLIKKILHTFKYRGNVRIGNTLAMIIEGFFREHLSEKHIDIITAVPLHRQKLLERGFNQAHIMGVLLAKALTKPYSHNNLCRVKKTRSQYNLTRTQRIQNVRGAFRCKAPEKFQGKSVLLIDDIFTTGATLHECARVLKQAGAVRVAALTVAR